MPWYKSQFGKLMIIAPIVTILVAGSMGWYTWYKRTLCDRAAAADLDKLATALERLANELVDLNCPVNLVAKLTDEHLKYLLGPHYGWRGTTKQWGVLIRIEKGEVWSCSRWGTQPGWNRQERWIFRTSLAGKPDLPPITGACRGRVYGYQPDRVYLSTMLDPDGCRVIEPLEAVPPRDFPPR